MSAIPDAVRSFWDADAATYDRSAGHHPRSAVELAAWSAVIRRLLPPPPARVLDVGAGTGFLSLLLAQQRYTVTALDLSPEMLARLAEKASSAGLAVEIVEGDASAPPERARSGGDFDAVVERHLLWTLPEPAAALDAWRQAAPNGRIVLFESAWGAAGGRIGRARSAASELHRRLRGQAPDHHAEYDRGLRAQLPLAHGATPEELVALVESSTWGPARLERLRDVDWATRRALASPVDRAIGVPPRFAIVAG